MNKHWNLRRKLLFSILLACLIPYLLGFFYIKINTEKWLYQKNIDETKLVIKQVASNVDESVLKNMQNITNTITNDERVINVSDNINNYVFFNSNDFIRISSESEDEITNYFKSIVESHDVISFISYGTEAGGYIEYPIFNPDKPYDPRSREWYKNAMKEGSVRISEPYNTLVTKQMVISIDKPVLKNNDSIGVISLTISLDNILNKINSFNYGETGYIVVLSPEGKIINSPKVPSWHMQDFDVMKLGDYNEIFTDEDNTTEGIIGNTEVLLTGYKSSFSGWTYIAVRDEAEVLEHARALSSLLILIMIFTLIIVIFFANIIASKITNPIIKLTGAIKKMSGFNFDSYEHDNLKALTVSKDEIGEISKALVYMQDNFLELKSSFEIMDEGIRNIDIEKADVNFISLSKENPLGSIASSVNALLNKVISYTTRIREINNEMLIKNELLSASEEELIAQLEEINLQKEKIIFLAEHDTLTKLPNRRSFMKKVEEAISRKISGAVILLDLDNFKSINDTLGHVFGDKILELTANRLASICSEAAYVSRFGGDEFLILFECTDDKSDLYDFINEIYRGFEAPVSVEDNDILVEFSMGVSRFPEDSLVYNEIVMYADLALYTVKNTGKSNFAFFTNQMSEHLKEKIQIKAIIQDAIENDGFKMLYQPKVCLDSGEIVGYEALIRLKEINVSPAMFIPIAEENNFIISIGRIVTSQVILQMANWRALGIKLKPVSINFSAIQFQDIDYIDYLTDCLNQNNISPNLIEIELTERVLMENKEQAIVLMNKLRKLGIGISMDDFGSEYSSLNYISDLPLDVLKFDRELNLKLLSLDDDTVIMKLIEFIKSLKLEIVAEGIEEYSQVTKLKNSGCNIVQGYYFSRPVEPEEILSLNDKIYKI